MPKKNVIDEETLVKALENKDNESILNLTKKKIQVTVLNILKELHLPRATTLEYMKKLKNYRYIDEVNNVKYGAFIKWIPLSDPDYLPLNTGGIICEIKITDGGMVLVCKNFMHRYYQIKMDECLLFQKLSYQEEVLLSALEHLSEDKVK
jgi:hypothetical protein